MTGIIFSQLAKNQFSITAFYLARANRIIPALAFLCLVLLGLGWFYLSPDDYADLGKHAASSTVFVSNFVYWGEAGYFAAVAHEKWLLHTWSLSVEWQFYIAYPVILVLLSKILPLRILKIVILLAAVLGFVFCIIATGKWFVAAYYLLPMRAWEMLVGGDKFGSNLVLCHIQKCFVAWIYGRLARYRQFPFTTITASKQPDNWKYSLPKDWSLVLFHLSLALAFGCCNSLFLITGYLGISRDAYLNRLGVCQLPDY